MKFLKSFTQKKKVNKSQEKLVKEIKKIHEQINQTDLWFQMESNSDLIDACIHQREMLCARHRYLINQIRVNGK